MFQNHYYLQRNYRFLLLMNRNFYNDKEILANWVQGVHNVRLYHKKGKFYIKIPTNIYLYNSNN